MLHGAEHHELQLPDGCRLSYSVHGNPNGLPLLFFHGGPGYHCLPTDKDHFDPSLYCVVLFDQRGCGRSSPEAWAAPMGAFRSLTIDVLVDDAEALRRHTVGGRKVVVAGCSWGSAVALAFAQKHATHICGILVQGTYLGTPAEHRPLFSIAYEKFPEVFQILCEAVGGVIGPQHIQSPVELHECYARYVFSSPPPRARKALAAWSIFENFMTYPEERPYYMAKLRELIVTVDEEYAAARKDITGALMQLILFPSMFRRVSIADEAELAKLASLPIAVVHGECDDVCPVWASRLLFQRIAALRPKGVWRQLSIVAGAAHDIDQPGPLRVEFRRCARKMFDYAFALS
jgi:proline iminopeptidase